MNDRDQRNLDFILSLTPEQFEEWYSSISQDDIGYAIEIMKQARAVTAEKIADFFDNAEDLSLARSLLTRFTLKGK